MKLALGAAIRTLQAHLFSSLTAIHFVRFVADANYFSASLPAYRARGLTKATVQVISKPTMRSVQVCLIVVRCVMDAHEGRRASAAMSPQDRTAAMRRTSSGLGFGRCWP